jgi:hypothetical protein
MPEPTELTSRQRVLRLAGGIGLLLGGVVVFQVSARIDAENRAALVAVIMIVIGAGWIGQGLRGRSESTARVVKGLPGKPVASERIVIGGIAAWLIPGAGHWILGHRAKALLYFATITTIFVGGLMLAHGQNFNYERDGVYFLAYSFNGLQTLIAWALTQGLERTYEIPHYQLGFLYSAVASLLNLVAMMDYLSLCSRIGRATSGDESKGPDDIGTKIAKATIEGTLS